MVEDSPECGFDNENRDLDYRLDHEDDGDADEETETNTTQPFQPGAASTPYHGGKEIEMQTMPQEERGLPETSFDEDIPLLEGFIHKNDKPAMLEKKQGVYQKKVPKVDLKKMDPIGFSKKVEMKPTLFHLAKEVVSLLFSRKVVKAFLNHLQISSKKLLGQRLKKL